MNRKKIGITILLTATIIAGVILYNRFANQPPLDKWISLTIPDKGHVGWETEALFNEVPLPKITNIKGDAKFVSRSEGYFIGYKVQFDIAHLDTTKVPKEYLIDRADTINNVPTTALGLKEVTYEASFVFTLMDKDGFELEKIESGKEYIQSGKKNEIQKIVEKSIPLKTIQLTKSIKLELSIDKCISCN